MPGDQVRDQVRSVRLSVPELTAIRAAAAACEMTIAGFIAHAAVAAARDTNAAPARVAGQREQVTELFAARRPLRQVGNNLNQIARALNSGAETPPQLAAVLAAVHACVHRVDEAVRGLANP